MNPIAGLTMSEAPLIFSEAPQDPAKFEEWLQDCMKECQRVTRKFRDEEGNRHEVSFVSSFLMGRRWSHEIGIWPEGVADFALLNAAAIIEHLQGTTPTEIQFLQQDENGPHFHHQQLWLKMQVELRLAVFKAFQHGHPITAQLRSFDKTMSTLYIYQGSALLEKATDLMRQILVSMRSTYLQLALQIFPSRSKKIQSLQGTG